MPISMQLERTMNNPIQGAVLMTLFCFVLSGCAIGSKSTDLEYVPAKPDETRLLKSIGYVFHDEAAYATRNRKYIESEKRSWIVALSSFTDLDNIFTMADGKPTRIMKSTLAPAKTLPAEPTLADLANDYSVPKDNPKDLTPDNPAAGVNTFPEFAKTHPIVDVYIKAAPVKEDLTLQDAFYGPPIFISFFSFGIIPAYYPLPYTASFTLSMPDEKHAVPAHWDYSYLRQEYYWFPLLIPMDGYLATFSSVDEIDRWKVEEKRRLVLMFLQDAKPLLQQH
jgi:hypothetical protein